MLKQESNCCLIEVTEAEVENSVKSIPKLDTLILVKVKLQSGRSFCSILGLRTSVAAAFLSVLRTE